MKAERLPKDPGPAAWNAILPPADPYPSCEGNQTADVVIVGGGFAGLAAARRVHQLAPDSQVVVLEARRIAEGPSGRNSGFMIDLPHHLSSSDYAGGVEADRRQTEANRRAIQFAKLAAEDYEMSNEAFRPIGKINAAATRKGHHHNRDYADHLATMGEPYELLDSAAMRDISGSDYYCSGLFTPGTAMLQPALYSRGMAAGLQRSGVTVYENSPAVEFRREGASWVAITPGGRVSAGKLVLSVNGHIESFGYFKRQLMHIFLFASMTRVLTDPEIARLGGEPIWGFTPSDPLGTTVRRISGVGGDRIVVRNGFAWSPQRIVANARYERVCARHEQTFQSRFPNLAGVDMEYRWGGLLCLSRNDAPAFGEIEDGVFAACCQNGLGTARGTLHGMLAAEQMVGHTSDLLQQTLALPAPTRLPPEPFASIGAKAVMHWQEYRAGAEL
ncbi:MAG: NAD(P)/FAD-dependent oxidoreductase [Hyphomicrobiaceae bacterium]